MKYYETIKNEHDLWGCILGEKNKVQKSNLEYVTIYVRKKEGGN